MPIAHQAVPIPSKKRVSISSTSGSWGSAKRPAVEAQPMDEQEMAEMADCVPEIVVMHARDSSLETVDTSTTPGGSRKLSGQG